MGFFGKLVSGLAKTRDNIVSGIDSIFSGFSELDDDFYDELEETLIMGDIGVTATEKIIDDLKEKVKEEKRLRKSVNEITFEQIRLACKNKRDRAIVEFTYATGLRVSELVNVNISDLDFYSNSLKVVGKGNKERVVLFSDIAKYYIQQYLDTRNDNNPALFISNKSPYNRLSQRTIQKIFSEIGKSLHLDISLHPHILRHTFATKLASTADITVVQKLLGHEDINTTMIYAEVNKEKISYQYKASKL